MRVVRRWSAWLVVLALAGCRGKAPQAHAGGGPALPVEVLRLEPGPVRDTGEYLGTLISRRSVILFPQVAGYVDSIAVTPGERVREVMRFAGPRMLARHPYLALMHLVVDERRPAPELPRRRCISAQPA